MTEQKKKPAVGNVSSAKVSGKVTGKTKVSKAKSTATTKKVSTKNTAKSKPLETKSTMANKKVASAAKKKVSATKSTVANKAGPTKTKSATVKTVGPKKTAKLTPEERYRLVETTAYFIAERHGFQGRSDEHWAAAEIEVAARLGQ